MDIPYYASKMISVYDPYNPPPPDPDPGFPYLAALTYDWAENGCRTHLTAYFQSAYPIYVAWYPWSESNPVPNPSLYAFARGEDSLRATIYWEHNNPSPSVPAILSNAYLRNCKIALSDDFTGSTSFGPLGIEERIENNEDILVISDRYTVLNEGKHHGITRLYAWESNIAVYNEDSTVSPTEEVSPSGYEGRHCMVTNEVYKSSGRYTGSFSTGLYGDYRVIYGKSFNSKLEWFNWCKTH